ncbi:MAG: hypothetical protein KGY99_06605 [Phycisphaerae bacterium]|nr:hypothetical protein [Phycisphaerae bacterium]
MVVLARRDEVLRAVEPLAEVVATPSGYEAAAELLAAPASALVVDLPLLGRRHLALLGLAQRLGAELLGVGELPAGLSADELAGVRLTAPAKLGEALRAVVAGPAEQPVVRDEGVYAPQPAPTPPEHAEAGVAADAAADGPVGATEPTHGQWRSDRAGSEPVDRPATEAGPSPSDTDAAGSGSAQDADDLLTPEELAALLEDAP